MAKTDQHLNQHKEERCSISETIDVARHSVYSLTRIRQVGNSAEVLTIGTAFLVGPNKLMTCSHVIDNTDPLVDPQTNPLAYHNDGDTYYLLRKDPYDGAHYYMFTGERDKNIHVYPGVDTAVITVGDDFYSSDGEVFLDKDTFLRLNKTPKPLGLQVAVLGYPIEQDDKGHKGIYDDPASKEGLNDELVTLRVDTGVVNAHYTGQHDKLAKYDFTMAFNPGNSGGPIIEQDGSVIALVEAFKVFPIRLLADPFLVKLPDGTTQTMAVPSLLRAIYSIGLSAENLGDIIREHSLLCEE